MKFKEIVVVAMVLAAAGAFAWWTHGNEEARRSEVQRRITAVEDHQMNQAQAWLLDRDMLRQAAWEAQHPCGTGIVIPAPFYALNEFPREFPEKDSEWCQARVKEQAEREAKLAWEKRQMPWGDMMDCVYAYSGMLLKVDTAGEPRVHDSWVLGGGCEKVANKLADEEFDNEVWNSQIWEEDDPRQKGICQGFADDSPTAALKCQKEMQRWLEVFCLNTTDDGPFRECQRRQLATSLEHGDDDERFFTR